MRHFAILALFSATPALSGTPDLSLCAQIGMDQGVAPQIICPTTILPADSGFRYDALALADRNPDTAWCEGARGSGAGQSIYLKLQNDAPLLGLEIVNGYAKTPKTHSRHDRVRTVAITALDGETATYIDARLDDSSTAQQIALPETAQNARILLIDIIDVHRGSHYDHTCLSELKTLHPE